MSAKPRLPFQNLDARAWQNLGMAAVFAFYMAFAGSGLLTSGLFASVGLDYRAYWSAGWIANIQNYAKIYDLEVLRQVQMPLLTDLEKYSDTFHPAPMPFLPVFILPFQALALLPPAWSFLLWTALNLGALIFYLRFFALSTTSTPLPARLMAIYLLGFPVYWNFVLGQVNVWLMICVGEFLRLSLRNKSFQAGLWLGGLLIKPQNLILIVPALAMQRAWKTLAGFVAACLILFSMSLGLAGFQGLYHMLLLWEGFAQGIPTVAPENMMNWRMLALHLGAFTHSTFGWGMAIVGMIFTTLGGLYLWRRRFSASSDLAVALLGTFAATFASTWDSHLYALMILLPLLIYLYHRGLLPPGTIGLWTFSLTGAVFLGLALTLIIGLIFHAYISGIGALFMGMTGLGFNLYLLSWAIKTLHQTRKPPLLTKT